MSTTSYMCKKSQVSEYEQIIKYMLWFDVEKRYKTTERPCTCHRGKLWFDVEKRYKTTYKTETHSAFWVVV